MVKNLLAMQETWVPSLDREGNGYPFQYSCLGNIMERGAWRATVQGIGKTQTREHLPHFTCVLVTPMC